MLIPHRWGFIIFLKETHKDTRHRELAWSEKGITADTAFGLRFSVFLSFLALPVDVNKK
jgi:hypothetical protein